ncbi:MAG TPA: DUF2752 domain-containing protein [Chitinophagaceae bacterium]
MKFISRHAEGFAWVIALLIPAFIEPGGNTHFSLCLFKNAGIDWCPGCGLGESIALFYRGNIAGSLHAHPLGIIAVLILLWRTFTIFFVNRNHLSNHTT